MSKDVISRQAAIDALQEVSEHYTEKGREWHPHVDFMMDAIKDLPPAFPAPPASSDLSVYLDGLWRTAYERGKAEARQEIVHCKECKHYKRNISCVGGTYNGCEEWTDNGNEIPIKPDGYCSYAERREDG